MQTLRKGSRGNDVRTLQRILHLFEDGILFVINISFIIKSYTFYITVKNIHLLISFCHIIV